MKSKCCSVKQRIRRPFIRVMATVISIMILVTSLGIGSIISVGAWQIQVGCRVYFDNSVAGFTGDYVFLMVLWNKSGSDWWDSYCLPMSQIGTSEVYTVETYNSGFAHEGDTVYICFFSSDGNWSGAHNSGSDGRDADQYKNMYTYCGGGYTTTGGFNLQNYHTVYFKCTSASPGAALTEEADYTGSSRSDSSTLVNNKSIFKHKQTATVYTKETATGSYTYVGDGNTAKGGTVSVQGRYWTSGWGISDLGYAERTTGVTAYGDYIDYENAARGSECTVTAAPYTGYTFDGWYWDSAGTNLASRSATYTYSPITSNTNIYAFFYKTDYTIADYYLTGYLDNSSLTATKADKKFTQQSTGNYTFTYTFTDDNSDYQYPTVLKNDGTAYHPATHGSGSGIAGSTTNTSPGNDPKWSLKAPEGTSVTFTLDTTETYPVLSWKYNTAMVYAKDGVAASSTTSSAEYGFGHIADTTISETPSYGSKTSDAVNTGTCDSTYESGLYNSGTTITVTTTIGAGYKSKYYVRGWNVNGVTKGANTVKNTDTGTYSFTYAIPADMADGYIEITPIYYLVDNSDTVTFYLEGYSDVESTWGNTPYAYPFYGSLYDKDNAYGVYPGQPFLNLDGKYSIEIPITNVPLSGDNGDNNANLIPVKGVTVSNGHSDKIHQEVTGIASEMQTYDSDGFYKAYNELRDSNGDAPNGLYLTIEKTTNTNRETYGASTAYDNVFGYTSGTAATSLTAAQIGAIGSGWVLYTDKYGRPIDIFGNVIGNEYSASTEANGTALRVISSGYNANISGDYGTAWLIYKPETDVNALHGTYTTMYLADTYNLEYHVDSEESANTRYGMPPSVLMIQSADHFSDATYPATVNRTSGDSLTYSDSVTNYLEMWQDLQDNYKYRYVYILYEGDHQMKYSNGYSGASRVDTRWFYSFATDMVSSDIVIEYSDDNGTSWLTDAFTTGGYNSKSNLGTTTGSKAYFTNGAFDGEVATGDLLINTTNLAFSAETGSGYYFAGWYRKVGSNYYLITEDASYSMLNSSSDTLVARFIQLSDGYLVISNVSSPAGLATTTTSAKVYDTSSKTNLLYDTGNVASVTLGPAYISNSHGSYYIEVTHTTTPVALNTFNNFSGDDIYSAATNKTDSTSNAVETTSTRTYGFTVGSLFDGEGKQTYTSLTTTSNITENNNKAKYVYKYTDRYGAAQSYEREFYCTSTEASGHPNYTDAVTTYERTAKHEFTNIAEALAYYAPSSSLINVYQKELDFGLKNSGSAFTGTLGDNETNGNIGTNVVYDDTEHSIVVYAVETTSTHDLTYHYYNDSNVLTTGTLSDVAYGTPAVIEAFRGTTLPEHSSAAFIGWSTALAGSGTTYGDITKIISPYASYGLVLSEDKEVYAVYGTASDVWTASIDSVTANRDDTYAYLNLLCRYTNQNGSDVPNDAICGLIFVSGVGDLSGYMTSAYQTKYQSNLYSQSNGTRRWVSSANKILATVYKFDPADLSSFNRIQQVLKSSYSTVSSTNFAVYAFISVDSGNTYQISDALYGSFTGGLTV